MDNDTRAKLLQLDTLYATLRDPGSDNFDLAEWRATQEQIDKICEEIEMAYPGFYVLRVDVAPTEYVGQLRYVLIPEQGGKKSDDVL